MKEYTRTDTLVANVPYMLVILLGAMIIAFGFSFSFWAWVSAGGFILYGIVGTVWIMILVCPYCVFYATRSCPCGYGVISAKLVKKGNRNCFSEKFKRHIPVIIPLWITPVVCGSIILYKGFSWTIAVLLTAFCVNSYIILPVLSRKHSCCECPQKDDCPWMGSAESAQVQEGGSPLEVDCSI